MSTHKWIDRVCVGAVVLCLLLTGLFMNGQVLGIRAAESVMGYEERLFADSVVHSIDIRMDDWEGFLATCQSEAYSVCTVVIDGESYKNIGIRGKGNTSLSTVSSMDSQRYSFKLEFDQYDSTISYHGLDKLSLNNLIQDTTAMKDYLTYTLMDGFGVNAPLCSYVWITVNGEDWGLYLAVEGVEDAFLQRNYGSDYGELYKPDSMNFGGGRGNGKDFDPSEFDFSQPGPTGDDGTGATVPDGMTIPENGTRPDGMTIPDGMTPPEGGANFGGMTFPGGMTPPEGVTMPEEGSFPENAMMPENAGGGRTDMGAMPGGMGSSDVKLQYIDDNADSYSNIFNSSKTDITRADQARLIESLKALSQGEEIGSVVDVEQVLRYFVVHNFVCNGDSYTGSMIHNYYLYEEEGRLSMIPWDYNLAFGTFQAMDATGEVNLPIDTPTGSSTMEDRPMLAWIFADETYTEQYHGLFAQFLASVDITAIIDRTVQLVGSYVEQDPTAFYTAEEFHSGVETLKTFCTLRAESVLGQLAGTLPSTAQGQQENGDSLIDADHLNLGTMGSMSGFGGNMGGRGDRGQWPQDGTFDGYWQNGDQTQTTEPEQDISASAEAPGYAAQLSQTGTSGTATTEPPAGQMPEGTPSEMPAGMPGQRPGGTDGEPPAGMPGELPEGGTFPDGTSGQGQMPGGFPGGTWGGDLTAGETLSTDPTEGGSLETLPGGSGDSTGSGADGGFGGNGIQLPPGMEGMFPTTPGTTGTGDMVNWLLLGVSVLVLALGLLVACKFKR